MFHVPRESDDANLFIKPEFQRYNAPSLVNLGHRLEQRGLLGAIYARALPDWTKGILFVTKTRLMHLNSQEDCSFLIGN